MPPPRPKRRGTNDHARWRTLKNGGEINPKYPGGVETAAGRLRAEGHTILKKGKRLLVAGVEKVVYKSLR